MTDNFISDDNDVEILTTSAELISSEKLEDDISSSDAPIASEHANSMWVVYNEFKKSSAYKKERKKRKKQKKGKKDIRDIILRYPLCGVGSNITEQTFVDGYLARQGHNIPATLTFNYPQESAFVFGRTAAGKLVGKPLDEDGHIAIFGGSGSGKSTGIAIPNIYTWKGTIFSFDFKGDLIKWLGKRKRAKVLYLLSGAENLYWYDPFYALGHEGAEKLIQNARELAYAIIPLPHTVAEPFWIEAARNILTGAIVYYYRLGKDFIDTMIEIKTTQMTSLLKKIAADKMAAICVDPDLGSDPKMAAGISMELHNHIDIFATDSLVQNILSSSESDQREPITWADLEQSDVFIRIDQSMAEQWKSVMRLMIVQLIRILERRPEKYEPAGKRIAPTLLMLDEFPQYEKIDAFPSALKILRSKNVTISIFCQSLADLDEAYGKTTRCTILDNCPYKAVLNASDVETQRYFSDLVGTTKVPSKGIAANFDELGYSSGYNFSVSESREPIIHPHEFASLSDIILLHPGPERFCRVKKETYFRKNACPELIVERR